MSRALLTQLRDARAFDQSPGFDRLASLHVPFDDLVPTADRYEGRFLGAIQRAERVALIGASGSGKSSITAYVLAGRGLEKIAPLHVRLGVQEVGMQSDPTAFPRLLVMEVAKQLSQVKRVRTLDRAVRGGASKRHKRFSVAGGISWLTGELALEIGGVVDEPARGEDVVDRAVDILRLITTEGLVPTLVLDDTDQWIRRPGIDDPEPRIASFFGSTLRLIAERLPAAACVVAVHQEYVSSPHYESAKEFLGTRVSLPPLPDVSSLRAVIMHRVHVVLGDRGVDVADVIERHALERLFAYYTESRSLRRQMSVLHGALVRACDDAVDVVGVAQIVSEIAA